MMFSLCKSVGYLYMRLILTYSSSEGTNMVFHFKCFSFLFEDDQNKTKIKPQSFLRVFTIAELKAATENFREHIGQGEFGNVYKGVIKSLEHPFHEIQVAVKRAYTHSDNRIWKFQMKKEWLTEINVPGLASHRNLVKLIGYSSKDNELLLVYEYMVNGSLSDTIMFKPPLPWIIRMKVAEDAARGLTYLHEEMNSDFEVILTNFKSSNILLDDEWNARLSDFGLAQIRPKNRLPHVSTMAKGLGTEIYIAPEGNHTSKTDVWSYGVFLYELITGSPLDENGTRKIQLERFGQKIDPRLEGNYPLSSAYQLSDIANMCLSESPESRPKMSEVLNMVQLITFPLQPTSPQVPHVAVDPKKGCEGPGYPRSKD